MNGSDQDILTYVTKAANAVIAGTPPSVVSYKYNVPINVLFNRIHEMSLEDNDKESGRNLNSTSNIVHNSKLDVKVNKVFLDEDHDTQNSSSVEDDSEISIVEDNEMKPSPEVIDLDSEEESEATEVIGMAADVNSVRQNIPPIPLCTIMEENVSHYDENLTVNIKNIQMSHSKKEPRENKISSNSVQTQSMKKNLYQIEVKNQSKLFQSKNNMNFQSEQNIERIQTGDSNKEHRGSKILIDSIQLQNMKTSLYHNVKNQSKLFQIEKNKNFQSKQNLETKNDSDIEEISIRDDLSTYESEENLETEENSETEEISDGDTVNFETDRTNEKFAEKQDQNFEDIPKKMPNKHKLSLLLGMGIGQKHNLDIPLLNKKYPLTPTMNRLNRECGLTYPQEFVSFVSDLENGKRDSRILKYKDKYYDLILAIKLVEHTIHVNATVVIVSKLHAIFKTFPNHSETLIHVPIYDLDLEFEQVSKCKETTNITIRTKELAYILGIPYYRLIDIRHCVAYGKKYFKPNCAPWRFQNILDSGSKFDKSGVNGVKLKNENVICIDIEKFIDFLSLDLSKVTSCTYPIMNETQTLLPTMSRLTRDSSLSYPKNFAKVISQLEAGETFKAVINKYNYPGSLLIFSIRIIEATVQFITLLPTVFKLHEIFKTFPDYSGELPHIVVIDEEHENKLIKKVSDSLKKGSLCYTYGIPRSKLQRLGIMDDTESRQKDSHSHKLDIEDAQSSEKNCKDKYDSILAIKSSKKDENLNIDRTSSIFGVETSVFNEEKETCDKEHVKELSEKKRACNKNVTSKTVEKREDLKKTDSNNFRNQFTTNSKDSLSSGYIYSNDEIQGFDSELSNIKNNSKTIEYEAEVPAYKPLEKASFNISEVGKEKELQVNQLEKINKCGYVYSNDEIQGSDSELSNIENNSKTIEYEAEVPAYKPLEKASFNISEVSKEKELQVNQFEKINKSDKSLIGNLIVKNLTGNLEEREQKLLEKSLIGSEVEKNEFCNISKKVIHADNESKGVRKKFKTDFITNENLRSMFHNNQVQFSEKKAVIKTAMKSLIPLLNGKLKRNFCVPFMSEEYPLGPTMMRLTRESGLTYPQRLKNAICSLESGLSFIKVATKYKISCQFLIIFVKIIEHCININTSDIVTKKLHKFFCSFSKYKCSAPHKIVIDKKRDLEILKKVYLEKKKFHTKNKKLAFKYGVPYPKCKTILSKEFSKALGISQTKSSNKKPQDHKGCQQNQELSYDESESQANILKPRKYRKPGPKSKMRHLLIEHNNLSETDLTERKTFDSSKIKGSQNRYCPSSQEKHKKISSVEPISQIDISKTEKYRKPGPKSKMNSVQKSPKIDNTSTPTSVLASEIPTETLGISLPGERNSLKIYKGNKKFCVFCGLSPMREIEFGTFFIKNDIMCHYFCLLFSSALEQKGKDHEGILGFLPKDIHKELSRGKKLKCHYCKKNAATIGCTTRGCAMKYHFTCGLDHNVQYVFSGSFNTLCSKHRTYQKGLNSGNTVECPICFEEIVADPKKAVWSPCCKKSSWFHSLCIKTLALSAGYFFKCPLCNDQDIFIAEMRKNGIFVPEQDASWEREPNAYQELLERPVKCSALKCKCKSGRNHNEVGTAYEIIFCKMCGSEGVHTSCAGKKSAHSKWQCNNCTEMLEHRSDDDISNRQLRRRSVDKRLPVKRKPIKTEENLNTIELKSIKIEENFNKNEQNSVKIENLNTVEQNLNMCERTSNIDEQFENSNEIEQEFESKEIDTFSRNEISELCIICEAQLDPLNFQVMLNTGDLQIKCDRCSVYNKFSKVFLKRPNLKSDFNPNLNTPKVVLVDTLSNLLRKYICDGLNNKPSNYSDSDIYENNGTSNHSDSDTYANNVTLKCNDSLNSSKKSVTFSDNDCLNKSSNSLMFSDTLNTFSNDDAVNTDNESVGKFDSDRDRNLALMKLSQNITNSVVKGIRRSSTDETKPSTSKNIQNSSNYFPASIPTSVPTTSNSVSSDSTNSIPITSNSVSAASRNSVPTTSGIFIPTSNENSKYDNHDSQKHCKNLIPIPTRLNSTKHLRSFRFPVSNMFARKIGSADTTSQEKTTCPESYDKFLSSQTVIISKNSGYVYNSKNNVSKFITDKVHVTNSSYLAKVMAGSFDRSSNRSSTTVSNNIFTSYSKNAKTNFYPSSFANTTNVTDNLRHIRIKHDEKETERNKNLRSFRLDCDGVSKSITPKKSILIPIQDSSENVYKKRPQSFEVNPTSSDKPLAIFRSAAGGVEKAEITNLNVGVAATQKLISRMLCIQTYDHQDYRNYCKNFGFS